MIIASLVVTLEGMGRGSRRVRVALESQAWGGVGLKALGVEVRGLRLRVQDGSVQV